MQNLLFIFGFVYWFSEPEYENFSARNFLVDIIKYKALFETQKWKSDKSDFLVDIIYLILKYKSLSLLILLFTLTFNFLYLFLILIFLNLLIFSLINNI